MDASWVGTNQGRLMEQKWNTMFVVSLAFHLVFFSLILFVPDSLPTRRIRGPVYEVDLVEMPPVRQAKVQVRATAAAVKKAPPRKEVSAAKRISRQAPKEKPVVIAKRVVDAKPRKAEKPKVNPTKLIDKAVSKIERNVQAERKDPVKLLDQALSTIKKKVEAEESDPVNKAISKLQAQETAGAAEGSAGSGADTGFSFRWYQMMVEEKIKGNWSYPVALDSPDVRKDLAAVVLVQVKNTGTILNYSLKKKSLNARFDQSVLKAVERSDPLPGFPPGYRKTYEELEINFNLRDLEEAL